MLSNAERAKRWRERNPERAKAYAERYFAEHRSEMAAKCLARYYADLDRRRAARRAYCKANPEKMARASRDWRARNPDKAAIQRAKHLISRRSKLAYREIPDGLAAAKAVEMEIKRIVREASVDTRPTGPRQRRLARAVPSGAVPERQTPITSDPVTPHQRGPEMNTKSGAALRATGSRASHRAQEVSTKGFDPAREDYEPWRQALAAFYRHDCLPAKALSIQSGAPFDYLDIRAIDALKAAFERLAA